MYNVCEIYFADNPYAIKSLFHNQRVFVLLITHRFYYCFYIMQLTLCSYSYEFYENCARSICFLRLTVCAVMAVEIVKYDCYRFSISHTNYNYPHRKSMKLSESRKKIPFKLLVSYFQTENEKTFKYNFGILIIIAIDSQLLIFITL